MKIQKLLLLGILILSILVASYFALKKEEDISSQKTNQETPLLTRFILKNGYFYLLSLCLKIEA